MTKGDHLASYANEQMEVNVMGNLWEMLLKMLHKY